MNDIEEDARHEAFFKYYCSQSKLILLQIAFKVINDKAPIYNHKNTKFISSGVTNFEEIEIRELFDFHWKQYKKERLKTIKSLQLAYVQKHKLFSDAPKSSKSDISYEDLSRMISMMSQMENVSYQKSFRHQVKQHLSANYL